MVHSNRAYVGPRGFVFAFFLPIALATFFGGILAMSGGTLFERVFPYLAAISSVWFTITLALYAHGCRWVEVGESGFVVRTLRRRWSVAHDDVISLTMTEHGVVLALEDDEIRLDFTPYQARVRGPLESRVKQSLLRRAREAIRSGATIESDEWQLDAKGLTLVGGGPRVRVLHGDIATTETIDDKMCIWRRGEVEAFARICYQGWNAFLLAVLLPELVASRPRASSPQPVPIAPESAAPAAEGLGRLRFRRGSGTLSIRGILLGIGVGTLALFAFLARSPVGAATAAVVSLGLGTIESLIARRILRSSLFCYERGVVKPGFFAERRLRFDELAGIAYGATRNYLNGDYVGTDFCLTFVPWAESGLETIAWSDRLDDRDPELEAIRDSVAAAIAARMADSRSRGLKVPWTDRLMFLPDGLWCQPERLLGRAEPVVVPYAEIEGLDEIDQGIFRVRRRGAKSPVVEERTSAMNFFPGYLLLSVLVREKASRRQP
ncbi:MAG: hypothetical protein HY720_01965 [Planctomycetes bacterium]|nr:hypothetical protein [Planctomycetota bacterium]